MATKINLLKNSAKTRVLWHDVKKFPSASKIYLDNLLSGIYGSLSPKAARAVKDLKNAAIENILLIENISIAQKIELNSLIINNQKLNLENICNEAVSLINPLLQANHIKVKIKLSEDKIFLGDTRYQPTIVQNILALTYYLGISDNQLTLSADNKNITITCPTLETTKSLKNKLSTKNIFNPKQTEPTMPALIFYTTTQLANSLNAKFSVIVDKNNNLIISYARK